MHKKRREQNVQIQNWTESKYLTRSTDGVWRLSTTCKTNCREQMLVKVKLDVPAPQDDLFLLDLSDLWPLTRPLCPSPRLLLLQLCLLIVISLYYKLFTHVPVSIQHVVRCPESRRVWAPPCEQSKQGRGAFSAGLHTQRERNPSRGGSDTWRPPGAWRRTGGRANTSLCGGKHWDKSQSTGSVSWAGTRLGSDQFRRAADGCDVHVHVHLSLFGGHMEQRLNSTPPRVKGHKVLKVPIIINNWSDEIYHHLFSCLKCSASFNSLF